MKVILGAGATYYEGWHATQEAELNLVNPDDWEKQFSFASLDALLAEHVWEHLTLTEGEQAAKLCYNYLKPGGYLRVAVPDTNFRNQAYQDLVQVGGPGPIDHQAYSHKVVYDYQTLREVFEKAGFEVELLEYCNKIGDFHYHYWNPADGKIVRLLRYDTRNSQTGLGMISIIIDVHKPFILKEKGTDKAF
ncbi:class I SAM-dependent methyltransferase [Carnobacterium gallinarum]|uniref:class I SAM-dependent methyltransferase n=1 Tax=Carnobacterium gallinarum TaxID=2749 RepID=UPI0005530851|nr:methyltransferase domain-containing protein [Carnobacterium gallinarum]